MILTGKESLTATVSTKTTPTMHDAFFAYAAAQNKSMAAVLRSLIAAAINK